ncbi:hypothetical protein PROFUN_01289 [Planoprotostelium fungivorum]|uniref:Uncharacterized protein n=1 Tax=Planoprotostelium fungivorum TaxID=1890364 RepID=A0A2P6NZN6_9EUKA|nr:hypothetical protein PROFUN_01289 [Planoprotostelium fungivorum]
MKSVGRTVYNVTGRGAPPTRYTLNRHYLVRHMKRTTSSFSLSQSNPMQNRFYMISSDQHQHLQVYADSILKTADFLQRTDGIVNHDHLNQSIIRPSGERRDGLSDLYHVCMSFEIMVERSNITSSPEKMSPSNQNDGCVATLNGILTAAADEALLNWPLEVSHPKSSSTSSHKKLRTTPPSQKNSGDDTGDDAPTDDERETIEATEYDTDEEEFDICPHRRKQQPPRQPLK